MKKSKLIFVSFMGIIMAVMAVVIDVLDKDLLISANQLPLTAQNYVQDNFPGGTVAYAKLKNDIIKTSYEVKLNNGFELQFDNYGYLTGFDD